MVKVKLKYLSDKVSRPEYATRGSLGFDLSAALDKPFTLKAGDSAVIPSGIALGIPKGYGGLMISRGGLAAKKGISLTSGCGVIDSDYTGEIKIPLTNNSKSDYVIKTGDRIAQVVIVPVEYADFAVCDELPKGERGAKGFGASGR